MTVGAGREHDDEARTVDDDVQDLVAAAEAQGHDPSDKSLLLVRFEEATRAPVFVIALLLVPLYVFPDFFDLGTTEDSIVAIQWLLWAVFAFEVLARAVLAGFRWRGPVATLAPVAVVVLPLLQPLGIVHDHGVKITDFFIVLAVAGYVITDREQLHARRSALFLPLFLLLVVGSSLVIYLCERTDDSSNVTSFRDGLWLTITTISTVGFGDVTPSTQAGRAVTTFLAFAGIAAFGVLTAGIAQFLLTARASGAAMEERRRAERVDELLDRMAHLERQLNRQERRGEERRNEERREHDNGSGFETADRSGPEGS